jgi:hypothetical protein
MTKRYPDLWLRVIGSLICSHLVEALGRPESIAELWLRSNYWAALSSGWLIAFVVWTLVSFITHQLDLRYDWLRQSVQRIVIQLLLGVVVPGVLLLFMTWIQVRVLWNQNIIENEFHLVEFPFILLILVLVNGAYFAWYLYYRMKDLEANITGSNKARAREGSYSKILMVNSGNVQVPVPVASIHFIEKQGDYSLIKTPGRDYVSTASLDEMENALDPDIFFRANRQIIIAFPSCRSIRSLDYGKLEVQTEPATGEPLVVSQKKAKAFREWMTR